MKRFLKENGLSVVLLALFVVFWVGQSVTGWMHHNGEQREHGRSEESYSAYLTSGEFFEATAENWESEFLQMAGFVWLTVFLRQKGSPESKPVSGKEDVGTAPARPSPTRRTRCAAAGG